ncbi:hypothetical protein HBI56_173170 [Parastagonospora nodorum]|nr:hypothetical protein HBI10_177130 [Parastagonospora nodorum]KAH4015595.1 hypothetical protein HBI09_206310 [Parastagonospora nodorum]KAH4017626.1 hypothetical protein HBI13_142670 [Parastagonospora nodorum]KAH4104646.1 hypothetical protein HBH46_092500 [Parastagonospora nodorum]KAH4185051.1 hypothetical protein HBH42_183570 [Parastagonospora nodorum]
MTVAMRISFDDCAIKFSNNATLQHLYGYHGPLVGIKYNQTTQITRAGCLAVCGTGTDYYTWNDVSSTLTTWILPVVGTMLQAPFESNSTRRTLLALARWIGSPIASLSYVLWNIKVSAKAALMVDMAVKYDETPDRKTDFGSMRDSMYLLLVMNQYALKPDVVQYSKKEAECLLRIALFSRDLELTDTNKSLRVMRRILARELREMRRRGAVPVFVSIGWFLFAFALSVEGAFNNLGQNTTAHDLALGCLLAWFPILIMCSVVDRNPIAAEAIRKKLNALVDHVRNALHNEEHRNHFMETFRDHPEFEKLKIRVDDIANAEENAYEFFEDFAGQARVRWHYGAAHPILSDIEDCYIAHKGRNWLADERDARMNLVLGTINAEGLMWFDIREFWQIASAVLIVAGSCGGAFALSYFTPTVGLGCRSGGYTIFFCVALGLIIVEMTVWLATSPYQMNVPWLDWITRRLRTYTVFKTLEDNTQQRWSNLKRTTSSFSFKVESQFIRLVVWFVLLVPTRNRRAKRASVKTNLEKAIRRIGALSTQKKWERFFFRPIEVFNATWLVYIVLAQTFGWYKTCDCVTSNWAGKGGYLDFSVQDTSNSVWVLWYWTAGTLMTGLVLLFSMFYITVEWCQQSFLSTEDYDAAMDGLRMTRDYRLLTYWFRAIFRFVSRFTFDPLESLGVKLGLIRSRQKTLVWTKGHTYDPEPREQPPRPTRHEASPSIELTMYPDTFRPREDSAMQETPAMAHSLFPPAMTTRRPPNESDASFTEPTLPIYEQYRTSDESNRPLVRRPSDVHRLHAAPADRARARGDGRRRSSEITEGRSSSEYMLFPASPPADRPVFGGWLGLSTVQNRQRYQRANSDPGNPPFETGIEGDQGGLGIIVDEHVGGQPGP